MSLGDKFEKRKRTRKPREGGGFSVPVVGGGINRPKKLPSEQDNIRSLLDDLEELRVLTAAFSMEFEVEVNAAVLEIRPALTTTIKKLEKGAAARPVLDALRQACNRHLDGLRPIPGTTRPMRPAFQASLATMRESFRVGLLQLASDYDLPEARDLARRIEQSLENEPRLTG